MQKLNILILKFMSVIVALNQRSPAERKGKAQKHIAQVALYLLLIFPVTTSIWNGQLDTQIKYRPNCLGK